MFAGKWKCCSEWIDCQYFILLLLCEVKTQPRVYTEHRNPIQASTQGFFPWDLDIETQGGVLTAIRSFRVKMGMGRREKEGKGVGEGGCG